MKILYKFGALTPEIFAKIIQLYLDGKVNKRNAEKLVWYYMSDYDEAIFRP